MRLPQNLLLWSSADSRIVGKLTFADEEETETLKSYRVKLYFANTDELISDSDLQYTNSFVNLNEFVYGFSIWISRWR